MRIKFRFKCVGDVEETFEHVVLECTRYERKSRAYRSGNELAWNGKVDPATNKINTHVSCLD